MWGALFTASQLKIVEDYSVREGTEVKYTCESVIGIEQEKWIKMRQGSFTRSGTKLRR